MSSSCLNNKKQFLNEWEVRVFDYSVVEKCTENKYFARNIQTDAHKCIDKFTLLKSVKTKQNWIICKNKIKKVERLFNYNELVVYNFVIEK